MPISTVMRVLAVVALGGVLFATTEAHAIVVKDKKRKKNESVYVEPAKSETRYVRADYDKRSPDRHFKDVHSPTRQGRVKAAPKKLRKRSHITELP